MSSFTIAQAYTIHYKALHVYTYQPGGPESMAQLLHQTFTLPVLLNEGEQVPTCTHKGHQQFSRGRVQQRHGA